MRYQVPSISYENGRTLKVGQRVRIKSRHGTVGTGIILTLHASDDNTPPPMAILKMDAGTVYAKQHEQGWPDDETRIRDYGVFGGEIKEILSEPVATDPPAFLN